MNPFKSLIEISYYCDIEFEIFICHNIGTKELIRTKLEYENCRSKQIAMINVKKDLKRLICDTLSWESDISDIDT